MRLSVAIFVAGTLFPGCRAGEPGVSSLTIEEGDR